MSRTRNFILVRPWEGMKGVTSVNFMEFHETGEVFETCNMCLWIHLKPCCVLEVSRNYRCARTCPWADLDVSLVPETGMTSVLFVEISVNAPNLLVRF